MKTRARAGAKGKTTSSKQAKRPDETVEQLLCGQLVCQIDRQGRLTRARYRRAGKTVGFVLSCEPEKCQGSWRPERGQQQFMEDYGGGHLTLYSSWHDGAEAEMPYQDWVDGHLADLRLLDLGFMRERVEVAYKKRSWKSFCELTEVYFRGMLRFDRFDPELGCRFAAALERTGAREKSKVFFSGAIQAWLDKAMAKEAGEGLKRMAASLGKDAAGADLAEWLADNIAKLPARSKKRVERLAELSALARKLADFGGPTALDRLLGEAGRFEEALPHAREAHRLEQQLNAGMVCDPVCCGKKIQVDGLVSMGTANYLFVLNKLRRYEEAAQVFAKAIGDLEMFRARAKGDREGAERILVGGLCTALDQGSAEFLERGCELTGLCEELFPAPVLTDLVYCLACLHARSGKTRKALSSLRAALGRGFSRDHAAGNTDLTKLHGNSEFERLIRMGG